MKATALKISPPSLAARAAEMTTHVKKVKAPESEWYRSEHSPIRAIIWWIELHAIPSFVSTHFVRHKIGVEHYVESNRDDRGGAGDEVVNRLSPVNHGLLANAQAIIQISRKRLCYASHRRTVAAWRRVIGAISATDQHLASHCVPECVYRGGVCPERRQCRPGLERVMRAYKDYRVLFSHTTEVSI